MYRSPVGVDIDHGFVEDSRVVGVHREKALEEREIRL